MNLPNKLTLIRVILVPFFVFFMLTDIVPASPVIALAIFILASVTDALDGHIARSRNLVTTFGKFLDPLADKVVIVIMLFLIVLYQDGLTLGGIYLHNGVVIALLSGLILSRELLISVFRSIAARKNLVLAADIYGKVKTVFLDVSVNALMLAGLHAVVGWIVTVLFYIGAVLAVFSGIRYIYKNKHVFSDDSAADQSADENKTL